MAVRFEIPLPAGEGVYQIGIRVVAAEDGERAVTDGSGHIPLSSRRTRRVACSDVRQ
ncbi:MAG: hypothetical protein U9Q81_21815 [Pseudomonadota bacterium]|nr:hypothetical protein [Pseudomonadota bacterium]